MHSPSVERKLRSQMAPSTFSHNRGIRFCYRSGMLPARSPDDALFLDFDGTLVEIAPAPSEVCVPNQLLDLLQSVAAEQSGALAIVSGSDRLQ